MKAHEKNDHLIRMDFTSAKDRQHTSIRFSAAIHTKFPLKNKIDTTLSTVIKTKLA